MAGMISAANILPNFLWRRDLVADDLKRLQEPAVIFEHEGSDADGEKFFLYTVAGWIDGVNVASMAGGATVKGEVILIHADNRAAADLIAGMGLQETIDALRGEDQLLADGYAALYRLETAGARARMQAAMKPDGEKSEDFLDDMDAIAPLRGMDIHLTGELKPPH
jgi:hypothetical protein